MKNLLYGLGLGIGLMYVLDPDSGRERRRRIRERSREMANRVGSAAQDAYENMESGVRKTGAKAREAGADIRDLAQETIRGSEDGENGVSNRGRIARRVLAGAAGGALAYYGLRRRGVFGTGMGTVGLGLLTYGATERNVTRLLRFSRGQDQFQVEKTIHVDAPVEEVFQFWSRYENFPEFMTNIKEVEDLGNGRSRWVATGPAGIPVEWEAMVRDRVPNERIRWESTPDSTMKTSGEVRFVPARGGTDVHVTMSYQPPAGKLGQTMAEMFGKDPEKAMEEDLEKVKPMLEHR